MRRLIVAVLGVFTLNMFLPGVACGDFFSVEQTNQSCCDLREGPRFGMDDMPGPIFLSSNPNAWPVFTGGPAASLYVSAGTLVSSTADTSIYAPGNLTFFGDLSIVGIPNGTACADFGWLPYAHSGSCRIDIGLTGS